MRLNLFRRRRLVKLIILISVLYFISLTILSLTSSILDSIKPTDEKHIAREGLNFVNNEFLNYKSIEKNGEFGKPFYIDNKTLNEEQRKEFDDGWNSNGFSQYVSDRIPLNRTLPDVRLPG